MRSVKETCPAISKQLSERLTVCQQQKLRTTSEMH